MLSLLQIDGLGKRYGLLPSEVVKRADTFDLYVMDVVMSWEQYQHKKAISNGKPVVPNINQDQLLRIFNKNNENKYANNEGKNN